MYAKRKIKYTYICEHCGHRNENFYHISEHTANTNTEFRGGYRITTTYSYEYKRDILTRLLPKPDLGKVSNQHKKVNYSQFDSKCSNCKKRQSWSTQIVYNILFVIIAISILLIVLLATIYGGVVDDTIPQIITLGALLLIIVLLLFMTEGVIGKLAAKRIKDERSIPEIVEVGEIEYSD